MKLMLVCTSGGHFATMKDLKSFWSKHDRVWVTDLKKDTEYLLGKEKCFWIQYQAPRDFVKLLYNLPQVMKIVYREKPDAIVSTGASIAISFALIAKLLGITYVYIESISRSQELSLSGKIVYYLCDRFYVQWPQLCQKYPKAMYRGVV
jgi:beta-1,4-N-acetylglucosaminyltransferase